MWFGFLLHPRKRHNRFHPRRSRAQRSLKSEPSHYLSSRRTPLLYAHIFCHSIHAKTYCKLIIQKNNPSSRRKSGPRLSACSLVASLGPGVRRDDGRKNEFNALIIAKMCESDSGERRDPDLKHACWLKAWVPAFAGMTI